MTPAFEIVAADETASRLAALPSALRAKLAPAFAAIGAALYARAAAKLDGEAVKPGRGRLKASLTQTADDSSASVGLDLDAAPYGAALEFGASIPAQLIAAKNRRALAFVVGGRQVFAKSVMRPAFDLPPHSFLRPALDETAPDLVAEIDAAVTEVISS